MSPKPLLSPAAALFAGICFFLPWAQFSCAGKTWRITGPNLGGVLWLVPILAAIMVAVFVFFFSRRQGEKSRLVFMIGSLAALVIIAYKIIRLATGPRPLFGLIKPEQVGFRIHWGGVGTILGFVLALFGTSFLKRERDQEESAKSAQSA